MSWFSRLFGGSTASAAPPEEKQREITVSVALPEEKQRKIKEYYEFAFNRARNAAALNTVRVAPGQDPYVAGHSALLFAHDAEIHRKASAEAMLETCALHGINKKAVESILIRPSIAERRRNAKAPRARSGKRVPALVNQNAGGITVIIRGSMVNALSAHKQQSGRGLGTEGDIAAMAGRFAGIGMGKGLMLHKSGTATVRKLTSGKNIVADYGADPADWDEPCYYVLFPMLPSAD